MTHYGQHQEAAFLGGTFTGWFARSRTGQHRTGGGRHRNTRTGRHRAGRRGIFG